MKTKLLQENEIEEAAALIRRGEPVGMPTETVYGLACDAGNPDAVRKVFAAKGRRHWHVVKVMRRLNLWIRNLRI